MTGRLPIAALLAVACSGAPTPAPEPSAAPTPTEVDAPPSPARRAFDELERTLLAARSLEITARITAEGAIEAELEGTLIVEDERVLLGFEGTFAGEPVLLSLSADAAVMRGGSDRVQFEHDRPGALTEGLLVGLTRMGLLHNLAVLASGNPPQGIFGDARDWVRVHDLRAADDHLAFAIEVRGKRTADARLYRDAATGLPTRREQTVRFPTGEMTVVETYETFSAR